MDTRLQEIIGEMAEEERKRKKPKARGKIAKIKKTKNGNIIFTLENETRLLVNKFHRLFKTAEKITIGDIVYAEGKEGINIIFCDELKVLNRNISTNQLKLEDY